MPRLNENGVRLRAWSLCNRRSGRLRWVVVFAFLLLIATAGPVFAASPPEGSEGPASLAEVPAPSEAELAAAESEERERSEWLLSPEAEHQRKASQTAYANLSAGEAQSLLIEAFPGQLKQLNGDPARVLSTLEVEKSLGAYAARVEAGEGESAILDSSVPVESDLGGEGKAPVDLALERSGSSFVPQNPITEVELPGSAEEPIQLQSGIEVELPASDDHGAEPLGDMNLFYPETETATDTLVAPRAGGVEVLEQLRSPESPERFSFALDLPKEMTLRQSEDGGAEIVTSSGKTIEEVPPPSATDAQGSTVPVTTSIEGNSLILEVPHRSREVDYPLLLDPNYVYDNTSFGEWTPSENSGYEYYLNNNSASLDAISRGHYYYPANTHGQWAYSAYGETSYIAAATFSPIYFLVNNCYTSQPHGYIGLYNVSSGSYDSLGVYSNGEISNAKFETRWVGSIGTRDAVLGIGTSESGVEIGCAHELYVGGYSIQEEDPYPPSVSVSGVPSGWFDPAKAGNATVAATDTGLGVYWLSMEEIGGGSVHPEINCNGAVGSRCPRERNWTVAPPYKPGQRTLQVTAEDPVKNVGTWTTTTKVDTQKPEVELGGQLAYVTEEEGTKGEENEASENQLSLPVYNLSIKATDGSNNSPAEKQSGVKNIEVFFDGIKQEVPWKAQECPGSSCSMNESYQLKLAGLSAGEHKLKIVATDQVGLAREREIEFEYIPATGMKNEYVMQHFPLPDGEGNESEEEHPNRPELAVNVMNGNLLYRQKDIEVQGPDVNLELERYYNSQLPESASSEWGKGWTLAQTPKLELEATKESESPNQATMLGSSGAISSAVGLPPKSGGERFDAKLHSLVTKESGGGYALTDESGETDNTLAFDANGKVKELRTPGYAKVDYSYGGEGGKLSEVAVHDPATSTEPPPELPESKEPEEHSPNPEGLVAAYSFEEGSGDIAHDSAGDHNAEIKGAKWTTGKYGSGLEFNAEEGDVLTIPESEELNLTDFTLEAWVSPSEAKGFLGPVIAKTSTKGNGYALYANPSGAGYRPEGYVTYKEWVNEYVYDGENIPTNSWTHLAVTDDGHHLRLYVNGELVDENESQEDEDGEGPLQIGGDEPFAEGNFFNGKIDEVRVYNRALDEEEIDQDKGTPIVTPSEEPAPANDGPSVEVNTSSGLVTSVEGQQAGQTTYSHEGKLLSAVKGPKVEAAYEYDAHERLKKVTLPNGTWGEIAYEELGRVKSVTVSIEGGKAKTTHFTYSDEPRETVVTPEGEPVVNYVIGADGSVLKWWNAKSPPEIEELTGSLYTERGEVHPDPISSGDQTLNVKAHAWEGVVSIQIVANGSDIVAEKTCEESKCVKLEKELVTETQNWPPGIIQLEVIVTDTLGQASSQRFWDNIPYTPPPEPGALEPPKFEEIQRFREEFGLDLDLKGNEQAINERIFELIAAWHDPNTPAGEVARASWERWGVPLRAVDVAELEYREWFYNLDAARIDQWVEETKPSNFAGYYLDQKDGGVMYIGFLGNQAEQLASLEASLPLVADERLRVYPVAPTVSYLVMQADAESVSAAVNSNSTLRELVISVKETEDGKAVHVGTSNVAQVEDVLHEVLHSVPIMVEYEAGGGSVLSGRFRSTGRMRAGDGIFNYLGPGVGTVDCTAGFGAKEKVGEQRGAPIWTLFVLTAGHCRPSPIERQFYRSTENPPKPGGSWSYIGSAYRDAFATSEVVRTDAVAIEASEAGLVPEGIYGDNGSLIPTRSAETSKIGETLCFSGARTQIISCGKVVARSVDWMNEGIGRGGYWVMFDPPAQHGDSGSPVFNIFYHGVGLVTAGRPEGTLAETLVEPLLHPPRMGANQVPGILKNPLLGHLSLKVGQ